MARHRETFGKQDTRSSQREVTQRYFEFLLRLNSNYMSIEICDGGDFPYLLIQISYFHNFNVGLHRAKMRFYTMLYIRKRFTAFLMQQHGFICMYLSQIDGTAS